MGTLLASCSSHPPRAETVASLADELVENLERRDDARSVRVLVFQIHENPGSGEHDAPGTSRSGVAGVSHEDSDRIGAELEHAFVVELSRRLNVVETEHAATFGAEATEAEVSALAEELDATHVLVGDYILKENRVMVVLRLIDTETKLITTAVRGWVAESDLGASFGPEEH